MDFSDFDSDDDSTQAPAPGQPGPPGTLLGAIKHMITTVFTPQRVASQIKSFFARGPDKMPKTLVRMNEVLKSDEGNKTGAGPTLLLCNIQGKLQIIHGITAMPADAANAINFRDRSHLVGMGHRNNDQDLTKVIPLNLAEFFAETTGQLADFAEASTANLADVTNNDALQADAAAPQTTAVPFVPLIGPTSVRKSSQDSMTHKALAPGSSDNCPSTSVVMWQQCQMMPQEKPLKTPSCHW